MIHEILLFFAQYGIYIILIIALLNFKNGIKTLISFLVALAISFGMGLLFYSPPPFVNENVKPMIPHNPASSFPSHHASAGFALAASTFNSQTILGILSAIATILMVIGRIYTAVNSKADIITGLLIGTFAVVFAYSGIVEKGYDKIANKLSKNKIKNNRQKKTAHKMVSSHTNKRRKNPKRR